MTVRENRLTLYVVFNPIGGVMVDVLASSVIDRRFDPLSGQTKDYVMGIYCLSDKHSVNSNTTV
jgi:hypothetical protein